MRIAQQSVYTYLCLCSIRTHACILTCASAVSSLMRVYSLLRICTDLCVYTHLCCILTSANLYLAPHLPALLLPLLQSLEDRDEDMSRLAKRCAELCANTPMLPGNVLPQVFVCVCVCVCVYIYMCVYVYRCTNIHMHTNTGPGISVFAGGICLLACAVSGAALSAGV